MLRFLIIRTIFRQWRTAGGRKHLTTKTVLFFSMRTMLFYSPYSDTMLRRRPRPLLPWTGHESCELKGRGADNLKAIFWQQRSWYEFLWTMVAGGVMKRLDLAITIRQDFKYPYSLKSANRKNVSPSSAVLKVIAVANWYARGKEYGKHPLISVHYKWSLFLYFAKDYEQQEKWYSHWRRRSKNRLRFDLVSCLLCSPDLPVCPEHTAFKIINR